jgi:translation initiation factor 3 subunit L
MQHLLFVGDPVRDLEYEKNYQTPNYIIPEVIKNFLVHFQKCVEDRNLYEIQNAYENGYV